MVGLGYVGLPLAVAFGPKRADTIGFDINPKRISELKAGEDRTREVEPDALAACGVKFTAEVQDMANATVYIVTVPTPIDSQRRPDLKPVQAASKTVGSVLKKGDVVVYESTVYPGVTEEVCGPILSEVSGLEAGKDFFLAYSPERINPGDKEHRLETIVKVVAGQDPSTLERVAGVYESIIDAGVYRAPSIKVAEAAKVIENTQRDLNIALMNELALIFDRLEIRTQDVIDAAATKWNFLRFSPGLVGGHCIGVDPYYLTARAEAAGYHPEVILAGRRINSSMGGFVAQKTIKLLIEAGVKVTGARVAVFGLTFKENVPDLRNSRVPNIVEELQEFGIEPRVYDPYVDPDEAVAEYGIQLSHESELRDLDALILAVPHREFVGDLGGVAARLRKGGVLVDVKSAFAPTDVASLANPPRYWSL